MPYIRTVKTKSGATAVQIVWSSRRGARNIEHVGSAHDDAGLEALKAAAGQWIAAGQLELDLGLEVPGPAGPLPVMSSRMGCRLDVLGRGYRVLGLEEAAGGDEVFRQLDQLRARIATLSVGSPRSSQSPNRFGQSQSRRLSPCIDLRRYHVRLARCLARDLRTMHPRSRTTAAVTVRRRQLSNAGH